MEKRALIALGLSFLVFIAFMYIGEKNRVPQLPPAQQAQQAQPAQPAQPAAQTQAKPAAAPPAAAAPPPAATTTINGRQIKNTDRVAVMQAYLDYAVGVPEVQKLIDEISSKFTPDEQGKLRAACKRALIRERAKPVATPPPAGAEA